METEQPSLQSEISDLKERYQSGEGLNDKPKIEKERKQYKTRKVKEDEERRMETFSESLGLLASVASQLVCSALPNPLPPTEVEVQVLNRAFSAVAEKHFEKFVDYDAELSLAVVLAVIIVPRLIKPKKEEVSNDKTPAQNLFEASAAAKELQKKEEAEKKGESVGSESGS